MPSDSTITTMMTMHIVTTGTRWKVGTPKRNGSTRSNQAAVATLSKCMMPSAAASSAPATIPSSTDTLATKPRPHRMSARITASTKAEMPSPVSCP